MVYRGLHKIDCDNEIELQVMINNKIISDINICTLVSTDSISRDGLEHISREYYSEMLLG